MSRLEKFACASVVAPCSPRHTPPGAVPGNPRRRILCDDVRLTPICKELARALANAATGHRFEVSGTATEGANLDLRYVTTRFTDNMLSGYLVWHDGIGRSGIGPVIELTSQDAAFDDGLLRDYARQLLTFTRLPH